MQKKLVVLGVLAALLVGVYGWRAWFGGPDVELTVTATPRGAMFMFNGRVRVDEFLVRALPLGSARDPGKSGAEASDQADQADEEASPVVWHLVPRLDDEGNPRPGREVMAVTYGQRRGLGLRPAEGTPRNGGPLLPGVSYEVLASTSGGDAALVFTVPGG